MSKSLQGIFSGKGKGCCASKSLQGIDAVGALTDFDNDSITNFIANINTQQGNQISIGGGGAGDIPDPLVLDSITANVILRALNEFIANTARVALLDVGEGSIVIENNTIISEDQGILVNPGPGKTLTLISPSNSSADLNINGDIVNINTVELRIDPKVPVFGAIEGELLVAPATDDDCDRGFEFNYPEEIAPGSFVKNKGFVGWDKSRDRFVFWRRAKLVDETMQEMQEYDRASITQVGAEIDILYTNIIASEDITGSGNEDLFIRVGPGGADQLTINAGGIDKNIIGTIDIDTFREEHRFNANFGNTTGYWIIEDGTNTTDSRIEFDSSSIDIKHEDKILLETVNSGINTEIRLNSGDDIFLEAINEINLESSTSDILMTAADNIVNSTIIGYFEVNSNDGGGLPNNFVSSSGDIYLNASNDINIDSGNIITLKHDTGLYVKIDSNLRVGIINSCDPGVDPVIIDDDVCITSGNILFVDTIREKTTADGILIQGGSNVDNITAKIIIKAENSTESAPSTAAATGGDIFISAADLINIQANDGIDISNITSGDITILNSSVGDDINLLTDDGDINIRSFGGTRDTRIQSDLGSILITAENTSSFALDNGAILIATGDTTLANPGSDSLSLLSDNTLRLESQTGNFDFDAETGINISNNTTGDITIINAGGSDDDVRVQSTGGSLVLTSQAALPVLNDGTVWIGSSGATTTTGTGSDRVTILSEEEFILQSENSNINVDAETGITIDSAAGNIEIASDNSAVAIGADTTTASFPALSSGAVILASGGTTLSNPGINTTLIRGDNGVNVTSIDGLVLNAGSETIPSFIFNSAVVNANTNPIGVGTCGSYIPTSDGLIKLNASDRVIIDDTLEVEVIESCTGTLDINTDVCITSGNSLAVNTINEKDSDLEIIQTGINDIHINTTTGSINIVAQSNTINYPNGIVLIQTGGTGNLPPIFPINTLIMQSGGNIELIPGSSLVDINSNFLFNPVGIEFSTSAANPDIGSTTISEIIWMDNTADNRLQKILSGPSADRPFVQSYDNSVIGASSTGGPLAFFAKTAADAIRDTAITVTENGSMTIPNTESLIACNVNNDVAANKLIFGDSVGTDTIIPLDLDGHGFTAPFGNGQMIWLSTLGTTEFRLTEAPTAGDVLTFSGGTVNWSPVAGSGSTLSGTYANGTLAADQTIGLDYGIGGKGGGVAITDETIYAVASGAIVGDNLPMFQVSDLIGTNYFEIVKSAPSVVDINIGSSTATNIDVNIHRNTSWYNSAGTEIIRFQPDGSIGGATTVGTVARFVGDIDVTGTVDPTDILFNYNGLAPPNVLSSSSQGDLWIRPTSEVILGLAPNVSRLCFTDYRDSTLANNTHMIPLIDLTEAIVRMVDNVNSGNIIYYNSSSDNFRFVVNPPVSVPHFLKKTTLLNAPEWQIQGAAVADATAATIVTQFNALLASLRAIDIIAT